MNPTPSFSFPHARISLEQTPAVLNALLRPLPAELLNADEGPGTWSAMEVARHLAWGEQDDWIPRVRRILEGENRTFTPFDREHGSIACSTSSRACGRTASPRSIA